jgi:hypothetical protein
MFFVLNLHSTQKVLIPGTRASRKVPGARAVLIYARSYTQKRFLVEPPSGAFPTVYNSSLRYFRAYLRSQAKYPSVPATQAAFVLHKHKPTVPVLLSRARAWHWHNAYCNLPLYSSTLPYCTRPATAQHQKSRTRARREEGNQGGWS